VTIADAKRDSCAGMHDVASVERDLQMDRDQFTLLDRRALT
jgi:hypothetical protein